MKDQLTRTDLLKGAAAGAAGLALASCGGGGGTAAKTTATGAGAKLGGDLRIIQWSHFVPAYDEWFDNVYTKQWGEENGVNVIVDHVAVADLGPRAASEVAAQSGHDLFGFLSPPAAFEDQVIDHADIIKEVESKVGDYGELAKKSTYNPKTDFYFGFSDNYVPDPVHYRKSFFQQAGVETPNTWDDVLKAAAALKKMGHPLGIGMSNELDSDMALLAMGMCFGSFVQNENNEVALDAPETVDAVKFAAELARQGMTNEVYAWDPAANNRFFVSGKGSLILNAISAIRTAETDAPDIAKDTGIAPIPEGPGGRKGLEHVMGVYVIWKFASNNEAAQKFLIDLVANYEEAFKNSKFYNFPSFPGAVPDIPGLLAQDPNPEYQVLADISDKYTFNVGYPGYSNAAMDETFNKFLIPQMFAQVARDQMSAEDSVKQTAKQVESIYESWRQKGKI